MRSQIEACVCRNQCCLLRARRDGFGPFMRREGWPCRWAMSRFILLYFGPLCILDVNRRSWREAQGFHNLFTESCVRARSCLNRSVVCADVSEELSSVSFFGSHHSPDEQFLVILIAFAFLPCEASYQLMLSSFSVQLLQRAPPTFPFTSCKPNPPRL
jgi:hypothetical protein